MVMHWVLKYHRLFVSQPEFESGGALWVARFGIIECFLGALVLAQIIHIGVIGVKFGSSSSIKIGAAVVATGVSQVQWAWVLTLPLPIVTIAMYCKLRAVLDAAAHHLPLDIAVAMDEKLTGEGRERELIAAACVAAAEQTLEGTLRFRMGPLDADHVRKLARKIGPVAAFVHPAMYTRVVSSRTEGTGLDATSDHRSLSAETIAHRKLHADAADELERSTCTDDGVINASLCVAATGCALLPSKPFEDIIAERTRRSAARRRTAERRCRTFARHAFCCRRCGCFGAQCWTEDDVYGGSRSDGDSLAGSSVKPSTGFGNDGSSSTLNSTTAGGGSLARRVSPRHEIRQSMSAYLSSEVRNAVYGMDTTSSTAIGAGSGTDADADASFKPPGGGTVSSSGNDGDGSSVRRRSLSNVSQWGVGFIAAALDVATANEEIGCDEEFESLIGATLTPSRS